MFFDVSVLASFCVVLHVYDIFSLNLIFS